MDGSGLNPGKIGLRTNGMIDWDKDECNDSNGLRVRLSGEASHRG